MALLSFPDTPFQVKFCFDQVIEKLEATAADPFHEGASRAKALLQDITPYPELRTGITEESTVLQNTAVISRLLADYFPPALTLNEIKAINIPYSDITFNHTERFKNILKAAGPGFNINIRDFDQHKFYVMSCCIILNEYYGTQLDFSKPLFYDIPSNGVIKHYRILYNADFLDIIPTDKALQLTEEDIEALMNNYSDLSLWKQKFPPESWILKGFAIMTLFDATVENAVSLFKEKLLGLNASGFQSNVESIFQSIYKIPGVRIGFTVFDEENGNLTLEGFGQQIKSYIVNDCESGEACNMLCESSYFSLVKKKVYFAVSNTKNYQQNCPGSTLVNHFYSQGIRSFILAPIIKEDRLLGVLEVVSFKAGELNSINANKLDIVMPFLTDTVERIISQLQNQVEAVIQEKYTSIHGSVYWKFRDEARKYINALRSNTEYGLREVIFPGVYPLYGEIDIKGSSDARNESAKADIALQLRSLLHLLQEVKLLDDPTLSFREEERKIKKSLDDLSFSLAAGTEQQITNFLESKVHPRLQQLSIPSLLPQINAYFHNTSKEVGDFHTHRRKYEKTIGMINDKLSFVLDSKQVAAQAIFPHYYERFKTDGIDHNLYVGPAIAPHHEFTTNILHDLRLWQLQSLCEMELAHHHLKAALPYILDVTSLILVHHSPIAIRFRMDEKRFDVDGSYNARYEIIKKRIDKAHIKGTKERITQPGKITIVYSNNTDEQEYEHYINLLQEKGLLENSLEKIIVEDLQGVSGLRALRVNIQHA